MNPKKKSGFKTFVSSSLPLSIKAKGKDSSLGELLPNGFRVGERIYYKVNFNKKKYWGTVTKDTIRGVEGYGPKSTVWAYWDDYSNDPDLGLGFISKDIALRDTAGQQRELLSNGFYVGERVYWIHDNNYHVEGSVAAPPSHTRYPNTQVWSNWDNFLGNGPEELSQMPTDRVFRVADRSLETL